MSRLEDVDPATREAARLFLDKLSSKFDLMGAILFGSRARRTHRADSDADVAVLLKGEHQRLLPTKLAMADLAFDVLLETGINVSPLPVWEDDWADPEHSFNPDLLRNIAKDGIYL